MKVTTYSKDFSTCGLILVVSLSFRFRFLFPQCMFRTKKENDGLKKSLSLAMSVVLQFMCVCVFDGVV